MKKIVYSVALFFGALLSANIVHAADAVFEETEETASLGKVLPKIIAQPAPDFPVSLVNSVAGRKAIVAFTVSEDGTVRDAVVTNSPLDTLNPYVIKAVEAWRFEAGTRNGQPSTFRLRALVDFGGNSEQVASTATTEQGLSTEKAAEKPYDFAPIVKRKPSPVYPYEMVIAGQSGSADVSFVVDYAGRPLFPTVAGTNDRAFARAVVALVEASEYSPGRKGSHRVMSPSTEHFQFDGEASLDAEARRVLSELRKPSPAIASVAQLDEHPKIIQQVSPAYPRALKDDGLTGQAEIEFVVSRDGRVLFPRIVSASHEDFGWAASVAVAQWRYQPPHKNGKPVEVRMTVPVLFTAQKLAESN